MLSIIGTPVRDYPSTIMGRHHATSRIDTQPGQAYETISTLHPSVWRDEVLSEKDLAKEHLLGTVYGRPQTIGRNTGWEPFTAGP